MSNVNQKKLNYSETTFFGQAKIAGISTILNWSAVWSIVLTFVIYLLISRLDSKVTVLVSLSQKLDLTLLSSSAGALGIIIAALSVTIALFSKTLLPMLLESKLLHKFLFPFWYSVLLWGSSVISCILLAILYEVNQLVLLSYIFIFEIFLFIYATLFTINLTGQVIRLALQNAQNTAD